MVYDLFILQDGYSRVTGGSKMVANCTCTLLKGRYNVVVDTMTPWDRDVIVNGLKRHDVRCEDVHYVICSHGHSDHIGNNNLFLNAKQHIVGTSVSRHDQYSLDAFDNGDYRIDDDLWLSPTPGHTAEDVTVFVRTASHGTVAITGDLFERAEDLVDESLWRDVAGSQDPQQQDTHRRRVLSLADHIVPGHGPIFTVTPDIRNKYPVSSQ